MEERSGGLGAPLGDFLNLTDYLSSYTQFFWVYRVKIVLKKSYIVLRHEKPF